MSLWIIDLGTNDGSGFHFLEEKTLGRRDGSSRVDMEGCPHSVLSAVTSFCSKFQCLGALQRHCKFWQNSFGCCYSSFHTVPWKPAYPRGREQGGSYGEVTQAFALISICLNFYSWCIHSPLVSALSQSISLPSLWLLCFTAVSLKLTATVAR